MLSNELTPAQVELLDYCSHLEADSIFGYLMTTLQLSIGCYAVDSERRDPHFRPTSNALDGWLFTLQIMEKIHNLSVEIPQSIPDQAANMTGVGGKDRARV